MNVLSVWFSLGSLSSALFLLHILFAFSLMVKVPLALFFYFVIKENQIYFSGTIVVDMSVHARHFKANLKDVVQVPSRLHTYFQIEIKWEINIENSIFTLQTE